MAFHTFPAEEADRLDDPERYRYCSLEELRAMVDPSPEATVLDLGVGTGFYAVDIARDVDRLVGLDLQRVMLDHLLARDAPASLDPVLGLVEALPVSAGAVDVAYSTMTFHEYATPEAHAAVARALRPGGRLVTVDWTSEGSGESGPSLDERFDLVGAVDQLQAAGFHVTRAEERAETFVLVARTADRVR